MPPSLSRDQHLDVAHRFQALAENAASQQGDARAWGIVFEFYAAVHFVRAYIRTRRPDAEIASHEDVHQFFGDLHELKRIKPQYDTLKQSSQAVRYYGELSFRPNDYERSRSNLNNVKAWVLKQCMSQ